MADDLMLGPDPAIDALLARLAEGMPVELAALEARYGRPVDPPTDGGPDLWRWPSADPAESGLFAPSDRAILEPDDYPAVLAVLQRTEAAEFVDVRDAGRVLRIPYVIRVYVFARHWGYAEVSAARNRLAVGALQALVRAPRLGPAHRLRAWGWRTSYSDVGADEDGMTFAGWWGEFIVDAFEALSPGALGAVDTIAASTRPAHPALGPL